MRAILYDEKNIEYTTGDIDSIETIPQYIETRDGFGSHRTPLNYQKITLSVQNFKKSETIELDPTMMKRIEKYNEKSQIKKYEETIKEKQEEIKKLDDILLDKEKRIEKLKEFVANIYDIDINNYDDEDDY